LSFYAVKMCCWIKAVGFNAEIVNMPTPHIWNVVSKRIITNMRMVWNFEIVCDKFNIDRLCTELKWNALDKNKIKWNKYSNRCIALDINAVEN
jgi:hypothetical protein